MHPEGAIPRIAVAHCYIKDAMDNRYERGLGYMYFKSTFRYVKSSLILIAEKGEDSDIIKVKAVSIKD